ncbi:hypothetical protein BDV97DRAFT_197107 [Delphinella strobiligena]|nr:hypothetical protein BDV97DRAFT_197107 [Delphinella strobiligena]
MSKHFDYGLDDVSSNDVLLTEDSTFIHAPVFVVGHAVLVTLQFDPFRVTPHRQTFFSVSITCMTCCSEAPEASIRIAAIEKIREIYELPLRQPGRPDSLEPSRFSRLTPKSKDTSCLETILSYKNLVIIGTAGGTVPNAIWLDIPQQVDKLVQNLDKQKPLDIMDIKVQTMSKIVITAGHNLDIIPSILIKEADTIPTSQTGMWISWLYRFLATSLIRLGVGQHNQVDKRRLNEWKKISTFANTLVRHLKREAGVSALRVYPLIAASEMIRFLKNIRLEHLDGVAQQFSKMICTDNKLHKIKACRFVGIFEPSLVLSILSGQKKSEVCSKLGLMNHTDVSVRSFDDLGFLHIRISSILVPPWYTFERTRIETQAWQPQEYKPEYPVELDISQTSMVPYQAPIGRSMS